MSTSIEMSPKAKANAVMKEETTPIVHIKLPAEHKLDESEAMLKQDNPHPSPTFSWSKVFIQLAFVLSMSFSWAVGRQFTKSALVIDSSHFYAPYTMVWINAVSMIVCYPVFLLYEVKWRGQELESVNLEAAKVFGDKGITSRSFFLKETPFVLMWITANYLYSQCLGYISASAALSIVSTNVALVCLFSYCMIGDKFTFINVSSVVLAIAGVAVISLDEDFAGSPIGIVLVVLCAVVAAFYKVLFKKILGDASLGQVSLFVSGLGLISLVFNAIPVALFIFFDWDHIEWAYIPWLPLIGSTALALAFNFLLSWGIALLGPLVISIGTIAGIPLSTAIDVLFRKMAITPEFVVGSLLIGLSFSLITFPVGALFSHVASQIGGRGGRPTTQNGQQQVNITS